MQHTTGIRNTNAKDPLTQEFLVWEVTRVQPITGDVICTEVYTPTLVEAYMNHEYTVCIEQNNHGVRTMVFISEYIRAVNYEVTTKAEVMQCLEELR